MQEKFFKGRIHHRAVCTHVLVLFSVILSPFVFASPWIETQDPFLRASLHKLSDNLFLQAPISSYPLRWNAVGDQIKQKHTSDNTRFAVQHLRHAMSNAQFARGNVMAKAVYQSSSEARLGFGSVGTEHWGVYSSYDHMENDFSFRLNISYADSLEPSAGQSGIESDYDIQANFKGSHLTLNSGAALFTIGYLERWWGPTWQHNLQQGSFGDTSPTLQFSFIGDKVPAIGFWNFDSAVNYLDQENTYIWLNRLSVKPLRSFEFGFNYQLSDEDKQDDSLNSYGIDGRLTLPKSQNLSHAIYANWQEVELGEKTSAITYGWEGQAHCLGAELTLVVEGQTVDKQDRDTWTDAQQQLLNDQTSVLWGDSFSIALYGQLANDHRISLVYRNSEAEQTAETATQIDYQIPFQQGMFSFGIGYVDYTSPNKTIDEPNFVFGYEYRY